MTAPRILIAGIGNIFQGDDAFGVEVARRLAGRDLPKGVRVVDFGVRGRDLAYALVDGYEGAILVDATARGRPPGSLCVLAPDWQDFALESAAVGGHATDPVTILQMARTLGGPLPSLRIVGCEPMRLEGEGESGLSEPVRTAVNEAVGLVEALVREMSGIRETSNA